MHAAAKKKTRTFFLVRLLASFVLIAIVVPLSASLNVYLVGSVAFMFVQVTVVYKVMEYLEGGDGHRTRT